MTMCIARSSAAGPTNQHIRFTTMVKKPSGGFIRQTRLQAELVPERVHDCWTFTSEEPERPCHDGPALKLQRILERTIRLFPRYALALEAHLRRALGAGHLIPLTSPSERSCHSLPTRDLFLLRRRFVHSESV